MKKPELLAPVGSKDSLIAAIDNGADAVYFGGQAFSARQYASNFSREELEQAIDYAHARSVRAYVTVNTLIKDSELEEAAEYLQFLCNAGADAVIVQDMGPLHLLREQLPKLPVHASTQMTIHNAEGVKFLQDMGVKRVVLSREMPLDEIKRIKTGTGMEIETFIHGALCFSYSGQCLLSSMIGGRSGNRGHCAQPCRKKYRMDDIEGYLLSPKDLNMSEHIPALVEAGIDSFKIEGRMKRPEYVAGVVRVYRKLIDRYFESPVDFRVTGDENHTLLQLFNREFTAGYFFGNPGSELMSRKYPHNRGTELGKVVEYDRRKKLVSIHLEAPLGVGDGIGIGGREIGVTVRSLYVHDHRVTEANPGSTVKVALDIEVKRDEPVFKTYDCKLMASLELGAPKKIPVKMHLKAIMGEPLELRVSDSESEISAKGSIVSKADSKPISKYSIAEQLRKLGATIFSPAEINFEIDDNIFIPISELNSIRKDGINLLERTRMQKWKRQCSKPVVSLKKKKFEVMPILSVNAGSIECFEAAVDSGADVVYLGGENFQYKEPGNDDYLHAIEYGRKKGVKVCLSTPRIIGKMDEINELIDVNPDGFLVSNIGVLYLLHKSNNIAPVVIDYPLNVFNRLTLDHLLNFGSRVTLSPELTLEEIKIITPFGETECIVQGFFPLMVSEHGLVKGLFPRGRTGEVLLRDEKDYSFPVETDGDGRTYVMNSRELCMLEYVPVLLKAGVNCLRIEAKTYDEAKTKRITLSYRKAMDDSMKGIKMENRCRALGEFTTGHYFRGVL